MTDCTPGRFAVIRSVLRHRVIMRRIEGERAASIIVQRHVDESSDSPESERMFRKTSVVATFADRGRAAAVQEAINEAGKEYDRALIAAEAARKAAVRAALLEGGKA